MTNFVLRSVAMAALSVLWLAPLAEAQTVRPRLELAADAGWKFTLGDPEGAERRSFDDASWRAVDLPHDWSIEGAPDKNNPSGSGGGYFPAGTGWYRKRFTAPPEWKGKRVSVEFDGVYMDATVFLNGHRLGTHPYGYTSFRLDLTPHLDFAAPNVLAVRVDNSAQPNSRWYSGSGIYRHVRVIVTEPVHVAPWGVFVTTPEVSSQTAQVRVRARVANESGGPASVVVQTTLTDPRGRTAGQAESPLTLAPASESELSQQIAVATPALWSPESPALYRAVTRVFEGGKLADEVVTPFGIRSLAWTADKGLLLNGRPVKLKGGCVHHDNGPLGAAAFDRAEERKAQLLKAAGFNAVRTAHNPPSPAFLDACDRLGLLVLDEAFDTWKASKVKFDYGRFFDEWWQRDLAAMVLRDRNHPSVIAWSIGNEIPEAFVERGGPMAKQLADALRALDNTRPVTLALPGTMSLPHQEAVFSVLDIVGYNYNLTQTYARDHRRAPGRLMLTTESFPADAFDQWRLAQEHPFILGDFVWTAMDYLGESGIGAWSYGTPEQAELAAQRMASMAEMADKLFAAMASGVDIRKAMSEAGGASSSMQLLFPGYPWHAANCGDLDLIGHRKPQSYYRDIVWNGGDRVYATVRLPEPEGKKIIAAGWAVYPTLPSWTWPGYEGRTLEVEVYSGAERVRLLLNGKQIGEKPAGRAEQFKALFSVPYEPGTLRAIGLRGDRAVAESVLTTAGKPARLRLSSDRTTLRADGQDLAFVTVEALDAAGRWQPQADQQIEFALDGPARIAAVGNGDGRDPAPYQGTRRKLYQGRALVVLRSARQPGEIRLRATAPGLGEAVITIGSKAAPIRPELR